jgi:tetratricopeptide (TPR) repeat protein
MAFGFGFNKQKVLSAAEKCVQQGKLQNAISEYEKVLKHDAKDLTVLNTVGDLHSRLGDIEKASECFKRVGDAYAAQGFTVKAIAMYKKLSKLKASMECVLRLAELYTQQGLFNDARAQYLQVAEDFLKTNQLDQAVRIFEKTLEMDPENVPMRTKLAEVYIRLGKKPEAWQILTAAAESLRSKGQLAAADEILQRMLKLEPGSSYALLLRGKAALDSGDAKASIECLSQIADLDNNAEALRVLFNANLRTQNFTEAGALASKLANVHDDGAAISELADALIAAQQYREALKVYDEHADRLLRNDPAKLIEALRPIIGHVKDDTEALEKVLALEQKAGESTHLTEIYELLAHAYVQSEDLERARENYLKLMQLEPANQMHAQNYQQVLEKQGTGHTAAPQQITAEEGAVMVDELEATAPFIDQRYDDEVALSVRSAMTDAELFISYNMPAKALAPLLSAVSKAPRDLRLNQKLAALHTRAGRFGEAAVCCRTLESIYHDAGHAEEAARYGDLAAKYEERSGATSPEMHPALTASAQLQAPAVHDSGATEFEISAPQFAADSQVVGSDSPASQPEAIAQTKPAPVQKSGTKSGLFFHTASPAPKVPVPAAAEQTQPQVSAEAAVAQIPELAAIPETRAGAETDLSSEWEQDFSVEIPAGTEVSESASIPQLHEAITGPEELPIEHQGAPEPPAIPNLDEAMEEVRFYLGQGMIEQAEQVLSRLEAVAPGSPELAVLRLGVESSKQSAVPPELEVSIDETQTHELSESNEETSESVQQQPWPQQRPVLHEMVSSIEQSLGESFLGSQGAATHVPSGPEVSEPATPELTHVGAHEFRSGTLDDFVSDLEASLGTDFLPSGQPAQTESTQLAPSAPVPAVANTPVRHEVAMAAAASAVQGAPVAPPVSPIYTDGGSHHVEQPAIASAVAPTPDPPSPDPVVGVDLSDMFGELKHELEEGNASADEDPETHYNLGVAFREMGLLDEAIGEFQKVCQSADRGHTFSQLMQTYTWLAQCFLDKGVPEAAVRWYERALKLPKLDAETRTALHYELASSFENAGNRTAALSNFLEVYGNNIDYRDVAERIKALRT